MPAVGYVWDMEHVPPLSGAGQLVLVVGKDADSGLDKPGLSAPFASPLTFKFG